MIDFKKYYEKDLFAKYVGAELLDASPGYAKVRMDIKDFHKNSHNMVHGGAIFSLADLAFSVASNSYGKVSMAINVQISFIKAPKSDAIYCEAKEISRNPKLGLYQMNVYEEGTDDLVADMKGMVYNKRDDIVL